MAERTLSLGELVDQFQIEVGAGRPRSVPQQMGPIPILRVADVLDGKIGDPEFLSPPEAHSWDLGPKASRSGDVVLTVKGTVGRVALMPNDGPRFAYSPQLCYFRPCETGLLSPWYLYYWLKSAEFWVQANALKGQTDMADFISLGDIMSLKMRLPSRAQQDAVADVLRALDDKIAANNRIAISTESLLRATFESCCQQAGKARVDQIGGAVRNAVRPEQIAGDEPYVGLEHMPRRSIWLSSWGESSQVSSQKSVFHKGDVLFGKLRPYFHKVGVAQVDGVCSTDIIVVRAQRDEYLPWLLMVMSSDDVVAYATARSDGTRMPRAKWTDIAEYEAPWPGTEKVAQFAGVAKPIMQRVMTGARESRTLAALRDTLLPQLMSGKLRVRDAERIVEDAV